MKSTLYTAKITAYIFLMQKILSSYFENIGGNLLRYYMAGINISS
jgi:hypothetical protein